MDFDSCPIPGLTFCRMPTTTMSFAAMAAWASVTMSVW